MGAGSGKNADQGDPATVGEQRIEMDIAERITYVHDLQFTDATVFNSFPETRDLWAVGTLGAHRPRPTPS